MRRKDEGDALSRCGFVGSFSRQASWPAAYRLKGYTPCIKGYTPSLTSSLIEVAEPCQEPASSPSTPPASSTSRASTVRDMLERIFSRRFVRILSVITTLGMFLVLVMGVTVTTTNSGRGCGGSWPLCNGQFIPEFAVSTFIEFSHRAVTGVETILVLALTAASSTTGDGGVRSRSSPR